MHRYTIPGVFAAVFFGLLPFVTSYQLFYQTVNAKHFFIVAAVIALAFFAAGTWWRDRRSFTFSLRNRPLLIAACSTLAIYWLSALLGSFPERSFFSDIQRSSGVFFLTHIFALALFLGEYLSVRDWGLVRKVIAISTGIYAFGTILGVEGLELSGYFFWGNLSTNGFTFGNSTFAGTFLLLALGLTLIELVQTEKKTRWGYALVVSTVVILLSPVLFNIGILFGRTPLSAVLENPMLILGSARASSASALLLLVFLVGYLLLRKYAGHFKTRALAVWAGLFIATIVAGLSLLFTPGSFVQQKYIEASTGARLVVWDMGFEAFKERPLLGWGPENFEHAHQAYFDNRLYQKSEYIGEVWFDRAHNTIVDTLVEIGVVGALSQLMLLGVFLWAVYRARVRNIVGEGESVLLFALPLAHFLQLQTGFDTVGSFALLGLFAGYGLSLERRVNEERSVKQAPESRSNLHSYYAWGSAVIIIMLALASAKFLLIDEYIRQATLFRLFNEKSTQKQLDLARTATSRVSSFESLRLSASSLVKGTLDAIAERKLSDQGKKAALEQMHIYEERYRAYLAVQPEFYRARMNFVYLLSVETALGNGNKVAEAKEAAAPGRSLSPNNLLNPIMESLLELYSGNPKNAVAKAEEAVALNPKADAALETLEFMRRQEQKFPNITVLRLENL